MFLGWVRAAVLAGWVAVGLAPWASPAAQRILEATLAGAAAPREILPAVGAHMVQSHLDTGQELAGGMGAERYNELPLNSMDFEYI